MKLSRIFKIKGFSLIELLIVIAIISTLSFVIVTLINPAETGRKSRDATRISDISTIKRAIDMALADKQDLSPTDTIIISSVTDIDGNGLDISKYLPTVPKDPSNGPSGSIKAVTKDCIQNTVNRSAMNYEYKSDGDFYVIRTRLESVSSCETITKDGYFSDYYETGTDPDLDLIP